MRLDHWFVRVKADRPGRCPESSIRWHRSRRPRRLQIGAVLVEFAVILPLLTLLLLGMIDIGQFILVGQAVNNASREGARWATRVTVTEAPEVSTVVVDYLHNIFPHATRDELAAAANITIVTDQATTAGGTAADLSAVATGEPVRVRVDFQYDVVRVVPFLPNLHGASLATETTMRRQ